MTHNYLQILYFDSPQMVATAHGDYTPVAEIMATANKVYPDEKECSNVQNFQVDPKVCNERFSDRLMVIPFGRMSTNLSASDMQAKSNEYDRFISSEEKPMELVISEFGDWLRRCSIGLES